MAGRPKGTGTKRTEQVESEILRRLESGETLRQICKTEGYPAASTVVEWTHGDPLFSERYARARTAGLDAIAEEIIEIADETSRDTISTERGDIPNSEWIARSRLKVDARKWLLSKLRPDKYGDRAAVELSGKDGAPIQSEHRIVFVEAKEGK